MKTSSRLTASVVLFWSSALAQTHLAVPTKQKPKPPIPVFEVALSDDTDYASLPAKDWAEKSLPEATCNGDGNLYISIGGRGLVALTPEGVVPFLSDQMTDIPHPSATGLGLDPDISAGKVSFRVSGIDDSKVKTTTWTDEDGHAHTDRDATDAAIHYIARFDRDGTYKGAIKLDLPFLIFKFATFDSGTILAQGMDQNKAPRIALLDTSAQFMRYLDLRKDISTSLGASDEDVKCKGCTESALSVVISSYFIPWNGKMLFWRAFMNQPSVYEVQESGEARLVRLKATEEYEIGQPVRSDRNWLLRVRKANGGGIDAHDSLLEVDPRNGEPLREYRIKEPDKFSKAIVSCFFDGEFWGVRHDEKERNIKVVRGQASLRGKEK